MKQRGFTNEAMQEWTFANDNGFTPQMNYAHAYVDEWEAMKADNIGYLFVGRLRQRQKATLPGVLQTPSWKKEVSVCMTNFSAILNDLTASFAGRNEYIARLCGYELLVLDDLGIERDTEYAHEHVYNVIDSRYRSGKPLIVTTNLPLEALQHPRTRPMPGFTAVS